MTWWAIKLILAYVSKRLAIKAREIISSPPPPAQLSVKSLCEQIEIFANDEVRDRVGHNILTSTPRILHESVGQSGSSRAIFPLTAAAFQFRDSEPEMEIVRRIKSQIASRKGIKFASAIESESSVIPLVNRS